MTVSCIQFFSRDFLFDFPTFCVSKLLGLMMAIVFGHRIGGCTMLFFFPIFFVGLGVLKHILFLGGVLQESRPDRVGLMVSILSPE